MEKLESGVYHVSIFDAIKVIEKVPLENWIHGFDDISEGENWIREAKYYGLCFVIGPEENFTDYYEENPRGFLKSSMSLEKLTEFHNAIRLRIDDESNPLAVVFDHADKGGEIHQTYQKLIKKIQKHYQTDAIEQAKLKVQKLLTEQTE